MASMNKCILIGNLGKDPELKMTPSGQAVARFSMATTETWKDQDGQKRCKTEWHNIVVWGKQAEVAEKYLRKGKQVMIEGRIQYREYTAQDGAKKTITEIRCDNFLMLGSNDGGQRSTQSDDGYGEPAQPASAPAPAPVDSPFEDDIPF